MDSTWIELNKKISASVGKNDLMSAIDYARQAIKRTKKVFGRKHYNSGISHFVLGTLYAETKQTRPAQQYLLKAWNIHKKITSEQGLAHAAVDLQNLLNLYAASKQQQKVEDLLRDAIGLWEKLIPQANEYYYLALIALGNEYSRKGAFDKAEKLLISKLNRIGGLQGCENSLYGHILGKLGSLYLTCRRPTQAIDYLEKAITILQKLDIGSSRECIDFECALFQLYTVEGVSDRARETYQRILNWAGGSPEMSKVEVLDKLSKILWDAGDYGKAQALLEKIVDFYKGEIQKEHEDDIPVNQFAALELETNRLTSAHRPYIESLRWLANLHIILGEYQSAAYLYTKIWKMSRTIHGLKGLDPAFYMMGQAGEMLFGKRPYNPAWKTDPDILNYLESLATAARLFFTIGDYGSFWEVAMAAFTFSKAMLDKQHPIYLQSLIVYAHMEKIFGKLNGAFVHYQECTLSSLAVLGYKSPIFREAAIGLASIFEARRIADPALELYQQLLTTFDENNPQDTFIAYSLNISIAKVYAISGKKTEAVRSLLKSVALFDELLSHIMAYGYNQRLEEYIASYQSLYHMLFSLFIENQPKLSEFIEPVYGVLLKRKAVIVEWTVRKRIHIQKGEDPVQAELFSRLKKLQEDFASQLNRSRFFPLSADMRQCHANEEDTLKHSAKEIRELEKSIADRLPQYATSSGIRQISLDEIISKLPDGYVLIDYVHYKSFKSAAAEAGLDKTASFTGNMMDHIVLGTDRKTIASDLAANRDFYLEMLSSTKRNSGGSFNAEEIFESLVSRLDPDEQKSTSSTLQPTNSRYAAFIVRKDLPRPQVVDIGEACHVEGLISSLKEEITDWGKAWMKERNGVESKATGTFFTETAYALSQALFAPVLPAISEYKKLLIAADGALFEFPFEILPLPGNYYLIEKYDVHYVDAVRNLIHFGAPPGPQAPSMVVADPDFDLCASMSQREACASVSQEEPDHEARVATRIRSYFNDEWPGFSRLKGAREEGLYVYELLRPETTLCLDNQALKGKLLKVKSPRILHIATHGFVFSKTKPHEGSRKGAWFGQFYNPEYDYSEIHDNPLLRCGLLLAGANSFMCGNPPVDEAEDGFLTGVDICMMDLSETDLVVLSACCTGLGEVRPGEGVFGMRRAFALAGARSIVVSLWSVPDYETKELLSKFYSALIRGLPKPEALREAKLAMINDLRQRGDIDHPYAWGAFICIGDPMSIERSAP
jgi:CHAT domain-containing protein/tetratricopeptide (TPR) repeat protein